jgi:hypothetical protein
MVRATFGCPVVAMVLWGGHDAAAGHAFFRDGLARSVGACSSRVKRAARLDRVSLLRGRCGTRLSLLTRPASGHFFFFSQAFSS